MTIALVPSLAVARKVAPTTSTRVTDSVTVFNTYMDKGLNLNYGYGDYNWRFLYAIFDYTVGDPIYEPTRLADCYTEEDFEAIAEKGFHHVRFTLDPLALGMLENPGSSAPPMYATTSAADAAMAALMDDVEAARQEGLLSIIDFHASNVAQGSWNNFYNSRVNVLPGQSWKSYNQVPNSPYNYLGTQKFQFLMNTEDSNGKYPLEAFWESMMPYFENYEYPLVLEILNEPYDSCYGFKAYPDHGNAKIYSLDGATGFIHNQVDPDIEWIGLYRPYWRDITKRVIQAIEGAEQDDRYIIVSNPTSDSGGFMDGQPNAAFAPGEGIDKPENVMYTCHFYHPVKFTHKDDLGLSYLYIKLRDLFNRDTTSGSTPYVEDAPMSDRFANVIQWMERTKARFAREGHATPVHVVFTEFGSLRADRTMFVPGTPIIRGGPTEPSSGGGGSTGPITGYPSSLLMASARWVYDARREMEGMNAGWTYYGAHGGFGVFDGTLENSTHWDEHGAWGAFNSQLEVALFAP